MTSTIALISLVFQIALCGIFILNLFMTRQTFFANNYNRLVDVLQSDAVRDARHYVVDQLRHKEYGAGTWTDEDKQMASKVCGAYGTVGVYLEKGMVRLKDIDAYHVNLLACYGVLRPFIMEKKTPGGEQYWRHFTYLADKLKTHKPKLVA